MWHDPAVDLIEKDASDLGGWVNERPQDCVLVVADHVRVAEIVNRAATAIGVRIADLAVVASEPQRLVL
jgi:nicotinate-nucleotide pyrophosphorylase